MVRTLKIEGMSCMHCVNTVTKTLEALNGVTGVTVELATKTATVTTDGTVTDETLRTAIEDAEYGVISIG